MKFIFTPLKCKKAMTLSSFRPSILCCYGLMLSFIDLDEQILPVHSKGIERLKLHLNSLPSIRIILFQFINSNHLKKVIICHIKNPETF